MQAVLTDRREPPTTLDGRRAAGRRPALNLVGSPTSPTRPASLEDAGAFADVPALFAHASDNAAAMCGFDRGLIAVDIAGALSAAWTGPTRSPASDTLRRTLRARPLARRSFLPSADGVALAWPATSSDLATALELRHLAVADILFGNPRTDQVYRGLVIVDRQQGPVVERDRAALRGYARLLSEATRALLARERLDRITAELHGMATASHLLAAESSGPTGSLGAQERGTVSQAITGPFCSPALWPTGGGPGDAARVGGLAQLTQRETQTLELLALGLTYRAIGHRLSLSASSVRVEVASITGKLGVSNRVDAVARYRTLTSHRKPQKVS